MTSVLAGLVAGGLDGGDHDFDGVARCRRATARSRPRRRRWWKACVRPAPSSGRGRPRRPSAAPRRSDAAPTGMTMNSWKSVESLRVLAAVEDVEHRHGQAVRRRSAEVAVERQPRRRRGGARRRPAIRREWRSRPGSTCSACRRGRSSRWSSARWSYARQPGDGRAMRVVDVRDGFQHALAAVALRVAVAQLQRLVAPVLAPDGTAARPTAPSVSVTSTSSGRVAAGVEDLAGANGFNLHEIPLLL